jgi:hypothetical protein
MATLEKRATPSQYRMIRAIAGAVRNAAHAHKMELPSSFPSSVAKRATGTLTADWQDVLAAKTSSRQNGSHDTPLTCEPRCDHTYVVDRKGDRPRTAGRSPIRAVWKQFAMAMSNIKRNGTPEQYEAYVRVLKLLDEAQRELDKL